MKEPVSFHVTSPDGLRSASLCGDKITRAASERFIAFLACVLITPLLMLGCSGSFQARPAFEEANDLFNRGNFAASLNKYEQLAEKVPDSRDRVLFEMGIIYSHPKNERRDYRKSLECFRKIIQNYPWSDYRQNSEIMIFSINNVAIKDGIIAERHTKTESLRQEIKNRENDISALLHQIEALQQLAVDFATKKRNVDRILIEKHKRRLTLFSGNEALKTYKIALGGNPDGPKERHRDNKTPEGIYVIDSRNRNSSYHLSLHISYPNEQDRIRAKKLGISVGGNIMIHGIKKGFSWVGDSHSDIDWTKGCIAVTDEEIEEIYKLTPLGTAVEIRP